MAEINLAGRQINSHPTDFYLMERKWGRQTAKFS